MSVLKQAGPGYLKHFVSCTALAAVLASSYASAATVSDYMVITTLDPKEGHAFLMSDSEIGAIGVNGSTSPPGSLPSLPGGTERTISAGITLDGDAAITNKGTVTFSNSDVHAINTGPGNAGSQGVDCDASYNKCTDNGSQISSNNRFNQSSPGASFSGLANNNGIQGGIDHSGLLTELEAARVSIDGAVASGSRNLSGGQINNKANEVWDYSGGAGGVQIIDINTNGNDFYIANSNLTVKGDADDFLIFRVSQSWTMNVTESRLLLDGDIGEDNVLFYVDADEGEESFNFDNVTFYGMSLWDIGLDKKMLFHLTTLNFVARS
ncbi:MAG: hypothetical protein GY875_10840 [Gammaproteobacteria bacterium]|nr:hypothetical protein [Gammaproteobacteria bacterium]